MISCSDLVCFCSWMMKDRFKQIWFDCVPSATLFHVEHCPLARIRDQAMHTHDFAEVFWVSRGAVRHLINGNEQTMLTGDLCMIRPERDRHQIANRSPDFTILNTAFPRLILDDIRVRYNLADDFWGGSDSLPGLYHLTAAELEWLNAAGMELKHAPQERIRIDRFLLNLLGSTGKTITDPYRACPDWLRQACELIHQPENLQAGVKAFFAIAGRAPEHVARTLKQRTGKTPTEVIVEARLAHAASLLTNSEAKILEVALDCGFTSLSYFYKVFQKGFGMTPRRYRQTYFKAPVKRLRPMP